MQKTDCDVYPNGWIVIFDRLPNGWYETFVRNARGDIHDKVRADDYREARAYHRSFKAIARAA